MGPDDLEAIDTLVEETEDELNEIHKRFDVWDTEKRHWMCTCPICRALELEGNDCQ